MLTRFSITLGILSSTAHAQTVAPPNADLVVVCYAKDSHVFATTASRTEAVNAHLKTYHGGEDKPDFLEFFSSEKYVKWSGEYRKGTTRVQRACGSIQVVVSANFLNSNPMGADGTTVFPTIALKTGKNMIAPETSITEECDGDGGRFGDCAKNYAVEVSGSLSFKPGHYLVEFLRAFRENLHSVLPVPTKTTR